MKITTRLTLTSLLPLAVACTIAVALLFASLAMQRILDRQDAARELSSATLDLGLLTYSFVQQPDPARRREWQALYDDVRRMFEAAGFDTPDERALAMQLQRTMQRLGKIFDYTLTAGADPKTRPELEQAVSSQLSVAIRNVTNTGERLEQVIVEESSARLRVIAFSLVSFATLVGLLALITTRRLNHSVVRSVESLRRGTEQVGSGHFGHRLHLATGDELGELGAAFDRMAAQLQAITVSRDALAAEVAERERVAAALRASEERERRQAQELRTLLMAVPAAIFITRDSACREIIGNEAGGELLGPGTALPDGTLPPCSIVDEGRPVPTEELPLQRAVRSGEREETGVLELRRADGGVRYVKVRAVPTLDPSGMVTGGIAAMLDVTELVHSERELSHKAEELQRMNQELESFAYVASHDLKAPLRAVANLAHCIDEDAGPRLDTENQGRLRLLRSRIVKMDRLIDGLLAYSRTNALDPEARVPVRLGPFLHELVPELSLPEGFDVELSGPLPELWAEPVHLRQVMQNLILNAVHHHDRSAGTITVSAADEPRDWRIEVADDGPGIAPEYRDQVFKMFSTLRSSDDSHTGIGLALVRKLVLSYGGSIAIEGNLPRGTRFVVRWPKQRG